MRVTQDSGYPQFNQKAQSRGWLYSLNLPPLPSKWVLAHSPLLTTPQLPTVKQGSLGCSPPWNLGDSCGQNLGALLPTPSPRKGKTFSHFFAAKIFSHFTCCQNWGLSISELEDLLQLSTDWCQPGAPWGFPVLCSASPRWSGREMCLVRDSAAPSPTLGQLPNPPTTLCCKPSCSSGWLSR